MVFCACTQPTEDFREDYDTTTLDTLGSDGSDSIASQVFSVNYAQATPLFKQIEQQNWEGVLLFLTTGKWSNSFFASSNLHMKGALPDMQVKTWVTSMNNRKKVQFSQLPIHCALTYSAPQIIIERLLSMYPKSARCKDNQGMLPLHLAFGFGAGEGVISTLLEVFPAAINERGVGGRFPYQCCDLGPNKARGRIYETIASEIRSNTHAEADEEWRNFVKSAQKKLGLRERDFSTSGKKLSEVLYQLLKDRKALLKRDGVAHSPRKTKK